MASMSFTVTFDDSEMHTLEEALTHYLLLCEREIAKGGTTPFIAHKGTIEQIRSKLDAAFLEDLRDYELWVQSVEKIMAPPKARTRIGRAKRALPRTLHTDKRVRRKRKPK
jgi:hypothetical protein